MAVISIGGSILGKGGNRIVVDDPHNPTEAESELSAPPPRGFSAVPS
jgi:hypothetical protein